MAGRGAGNEVASPRPGESDGRPGDQLSGRVYLRTPARTDRAEFIGLMRASRAFHRPWATAPTDDERMTSKACVASTGKPPSRQRLNS